ncbi:MAG: hypothetical protein H6617_10935 [Bdellovibrionaceae bacterium]|nr:hypothetical protein [Bdellovibrionales bacterium]MCB9255187.1 hypothetical protein [Pseudobdellovibrionaceae bacterium]
MERTLKLSSVFGIWIVLQSTIVFGFEPAQDKDIQITGKDEQEVVVQPKVWVEVFQSNYRPIMPRLAGDFVFYSSLNERDTRLGCAGRHLYALPLKPVKEKRQEQLVARYDCLLQIQTFGSDVYVTYRYTPAQTDTSVKEAPAPQLRIDRIDAGGEDALSVTANKFPEVVGERGQAAHQVRFAVKMDDLKRSRDTKAQRTSLINHDELFVLAEVGEGEKRETFLDILSLKDPWDSSSEPVIDVPIKSEPVADFLIPRQNELILALDGTRLKMGQLLFLGWDGKKLKVTKEIGKTERLAPSWTEVDESDFAIRHPRFLALTPNGMLGSEKGNSSGQQFVFYYSFDDKKVYKVSHLSRFITQIAGFQFVNYGDEPGLLVTDSDNRWIRWYGNKSPFPKDMSVKTLTDKDSGSLPTAPQPKAKVPDEKLVPEEKG